LTTGGVAYVAGPSSVLGFFFRLIWNPLTSMIS